ncbi:hypothetical protein ACFWSF_20290 [Streptomyces sp. NPDC058611]
MHHASEAAVTAVRAIAAEYGLGVSVTEDIGADMTSLRAGAGQAARHG